MQHRKKDTLQTAAAKAGFSSATAYRVEDDPRPPSTRTKPRIQVNMEYFTKNTFYG